MPGFLGTFSVNFEIPDYRGIGKSVSRGFGTVLRQSPDIQMTEDRLSKDRGQRTEVRRQKTEEIKQNYEET